MKKRLGIIGGGQLGMMITEAAQNLSDEISEIIVLDPTQNCPASKAGAKEITADFKDENAIFELAEKYRKEGMAAYSRIQQQEFAREKDGYTSVKHQREVGTSYFDAVSNTISSGKSTTTAMKGSTEDEQF